MTKELDYLVPYSNDSYFDYAVLEAGEQPFGEVYRIGDSVVMESFSGWGAPNISRSLAKSAYRDGSYISGEKYDDRNLTMNLFTDGCSRDEYWGLRHELVAALTNNNRQSRYFSQVPYWYLTASGDTSGNWDNTLFSDPTPYLPVDIFKYTASGAYPVKWVKELTSGKTYHTYTHYTGGAKFDPRDLDEWNEWGFNETIEFTSVDPYIYLTDTRHIDFTMPNTNKAIQFDYWGDKQAKPVLDLYNWGGAINMPGAQVDITVSFQLSKYQDIENEITNSEEVKITLTWEDLFVGGLLPFPPDNNTRLILNLTPRNTGMYFVVRFNTGGTNSEWVGASATGVIKDAKSLQNFSTAGISPVPDPQFTPVPGEPDWETDVVRQYIFEPDSDWETRGLSGIKILSSITGIGGHLSFMETYGGI